MRNITKYSALSAAIVFFISTCLLLTMRSLGHRPEYSYFTLGGIQFLLLMALVAVGSLAILFYPATKKILKNFFLVQTHPMNLALFRIIICAKLVSSGFDPTLVRWFGGFPPVLQFPPVGTHWLLTFLPIDPTLGAAAFFLFKIFCFVGMLGWCTRFALWMAVFFGFYALGIPQFFGKVNHNHHLLWFLAILASSPSNHFLSIDAFVRSWRRADEGDTRPPAASRAYALPLRFVWILIGIIYFFPGWWKLWVSGLQWITGDTMRNYIYYQWMGYGGWVSAIRVDHYPVLCKVMAFMGVAFELTFIFLIFFPQIRWIPLTFGLTFHTLTFVIMRISFLDLQLAYAAFVEWQNVFNRLGRWMFKDDLLVIYDGNCKLCRRTIASLRTFDVMGRITYINMFDKPNADRPDVKRFDAVTLSRDMHGVIGQRVVTGFETYREMAKRMPLLWPLVVFLYVWPITAVGRAIYRRVADSRSCTIKDRVTPAENTPQTPASVGRLSVTLGIILIVANTLFGAYKIGGGWPFACYPTFEDMPGENYYSLEISFVNSNGEHVILDEHVLSQNFPPERFMGLVSKLLNTKDPDLKAKRLKAFWTMIAQNNPALRSARVVEFNRLDLYMIPEKKHLNPISRTKIYELRLP